MIDPTLKNRLVGVAVLLLVAALLLPLLFDGANEQALLADTRMPVPPVVPEAGELLADPPSVLPQADAELTAAHEPVEPEAAPVTPAPVAAAPAPAATVATTPAAAAIPAPAPVVTPAPAPVADTRLAALAEAWDVQVAAVSTRESADQLRGRLTMAGYKARVLPAGKLFKILVGPELRREDATALRDRLAADGRVGKLKGNLVRYIP